MDKMLKKAQDIPLTEDSGDVERDVAVTALKEFKEKNYEQAYLLMVRLEVARPNDFKVVCNKLVAELYKSGVKQLLAYSQSVEQLLCRRFAIPPSAIMARGRSAVDIQPEHAVIYYNQAVLLYNKKQYNHALHILNMIYAMADMLDNTLAFRLAFLLTELYIKTDQVNKALLTVAYIEKNFYSTNGSQRQVKEHANISTDSMRAVLQQYKTRAYMICKSVKSGKREIKNLMMLAGNNISNIYLKANFEYLRHNYRKAERVLLTAPKAAPSVQTGQNVPAMYYNNLALCQVFLGKLTRAHVYFVKAIQENQKILSGLKEQRLAGGSKVPLHCMAIDRHAEILHNLGVTFLYLGKPREAFDCLIETARCYPDSPRLWLRLAESCMACNSVYVSSVTGAERCDPPTYVEAELIGRGEAHRKVLAHPVSQRRLPVSGTGCAGGGDVDSQAVPEVSLEFASYCIRSALTLIPAADTDLATATAAASPQLADGQHEDGATGATGATATHLLYSPPGLPLKPGGNDIPLLRCSVLASGAYIAFRLGNYNEALHYANQLLQHPPHIIPSALKFLGHLYKSQALIMLEQISAAIDCLHPDHIGTGDISMLPPQLAAQSQPQLASQLPQPTPVADTTGDPWNVNRTDVTGQLGPRSAYSHGNNTRWWPHSPHTAKTTFAYQLAVAFAIRGELDKARTMLDKARMANEGTTPLAAYFTYLELYILLSQGDISGAQRLVKLDYPRTN